MAVPKVGRISKRNVKTLARRLREDEGLRREATTLMRRNFHSFVERAFELTPEQRKEMRAKMPKPAADTVARACILALETGGPIDFEIVRDRPTPDLRIETYCKGDGDDIECGVRVTWEK
ncbi:MAG TPA: hypothetical protein VEL10_10715 [Gaiellaceae bacterium]|nr:hypothetical protein [Gaiellaceae bacterium]